MPQTAPVVEVSVHSVKVEGVEVKRPARISVSDWLRFWEQVVSGWCPKCGRSVR